MPYPNEHSCRLRDPGELDIVGSGERRHDGKVYRVIYGKPKGGDGSVEQAYRYPKDTWSESEARSHCKAHDGILFEPATDQASAGVELRFWAAVHSIETGEEQRLATFYLLNTSLNQNRWRVTDKALEDALATLINKPLGCIPGYRVNHVYESLDVGRWVRVDKPDGYALGVAEITDDIAWEKLSSGEWGPISVVIRAFKVTCSVCGQDITEAPDEHIKSGEGHEIIESFVFVRVDFVDEPAYPQAGVLALSMLGQSGVGETPSALTAEKGGGMQGGFVRFAGVIPFAETQKAPEERAWDADAAEARIRRWAGGPEKENIRWSDYRRAFAWYDSGDPENFGSYKLPHHDVIDGRLHVVWRGVVAAMQVTLGARDGVDIPQTEHRGTFNHMARHYRQFDKEVPEYHTSQSAKDGAQGPRGDPKPDGKRENLKMEEKIAELESELENLKTANTELKDELETLKAENKELKGEAGMDEKISELKGELEEVKAENKKLTDDLEKRIAERHQELVDRALEARSKAGLVRDREAETERLKELDDKTLILLAEDAGKVAERLEKAQPTGPKAKFTPEYKSSFEASVEDMREELFGYRRDAEGKVVV